MTRISKTPDGALYYIKEQDGRFSVFRKEPHAHGYPWGPRHKTMEDAERYLAKIAKEKGLTEGAW